MNMMKRFLLPLMLALGLAASSARAVCDPSLSATTTPNLALPYPVQGQCDWHTPLQQLITALDNRLPLLDTTRPFTAQQAFNAGVISTTIKLTTGAGTSGKCWVSSDAAGNGAWTTCPSGGGGWTDQGTTVELTTGTDNVGIGTAGTATGRLHIKGSGAQFLRLETTSATARAWEVYADGASAGSFYVKDVTGGSLVPFLIKAGAPTNTLTLDASGNVIVGQSSTSVNGIELKRTVTGDVTLQVFNASTGAGTDNARVNIIAGNGSAGDPFLNFVVNGVANWSVGIDNSDSDKLKINPAAGVSGGSDKFVLDSSGNLTLGGTVTATGTSVFPSIKLTTGAGTSNQCWVSSDTLGNGAWTACPGGGSGHTIQNNGSNLTTRTGLNFVPPLQAVDNSGSNRSDVSVISDGIDFSDLSDSLTLDASTQITLGSANFTFLQTSGVGRFFIAGNAFGVSPELMFTSGGGAADGLASIVTTDNGGYGGNLEFNVRNNNPTSWAAGKRKAASLTGADGALNLFGTSSGGPTLNFTAGTGLVALANFVSSTPTVRLNGTEASGVSLDLKENTGHLYLRKTSTADAYAEFDYNFAGGDYFVGPYGGARLSLRAGGYADETFGEMTVLGVSYPAHFMANHLDNEMWPMFMYGGYAVDRRYYNFNVYSPQWAIFPFMNQNIPRQLMISYPGNPQALFSARFAAGNPPVPDPDRNNYREALTLAVAESCANTTRSVCTSFSEFNKGLLCTGSAGSAPGVGCNGSTCSSQANESCGDGTNGGLHLGYRYYMTYGFYDAQGGDARTPADGFQGGRTRDSRQAGVDIPSTDGVGRGYKVKVTLPKLCYAGATSTSSVCNHNGASCSVDGDCGTGNLCVNSRITCSVNGDCGAGGSCSWMPSTAEGSVVYVTGKQPTASPPPSVNALRFRQAFMPRTCSVDADCGGGSGSCSSSLCKSTYVYGMNNDVANGIFEAEQPTDFNATLAEQFALYPSSGSWPVVMIRPEGHGFDLKFLAQDTFNTAALFDTIGQYLLYRTPGDANSALKLDTVASGGQIEFGAGGGTALDTNLYRGGANVLRTDDQLNVQNGLIFELSGANGIIRFGNAGTFDTAIYRVDATTLQTDEVWKTTKDANTTVTGGTVNVRTADAGAVSATGDLSSKTLGGSVSVGRVFHVVTGGTYTWTTPGSVRYQVTLGGVVVCDMTATVLTAGGNYFTDLWITVQSGNNPAVTRCNGTVNFSNGSTVTSTQQAQSIVNTDATTANLSGTPVIKTNVIIVNTVSMTEKTAIFAMEN
jgi:hypothetical protein